MPEPHDLDELFGPLTTITLAPPAPVAQLDSLHPERSTPYPGRARCASIDVDGHPVTVTLISDLADRDGFMDQWAGFQRDGRPYAEVEATPDQRGLIARSPAAEPSKAVPDPFIIRAVGDHGVVLVQGRGELTDQLLELAASVTP